MGCRDAHVGVMGVWFFDVIISKYQLFDVGCIVHLRAQKLFLNYEGELFHQHKSGSRAHDTVTVSPHHLITEKVGDSFLLSPLRLVAQAENVLFLVDQTRVCD